MSLPLKAVAINAEASNDSATESDVRAMKYEARAVASDVHAKPSHVNATTSDESATTSDDGASTPDVHAMATPLSEIRNYTIKQLLKVFLSQQNYFNIFNTTKKKNLFIFGLVTKKIKPC